MSSGEGWEKYSSCTGEIFLKFKPPAPAHGLKDGAWEISPKFHMGLSNKENDLTFFIEMDGARD